MSAIAKFRLYPEAPHGLYVLVTVWPSREELHANCSCIEKGEHEGCCSGLTITSFPEGGPPRTAALCAEVHLWWEKLTMQVITHELFHATMAWARRIRFRWQRLGDDDAVNDEEERLAYAHGRLCRDLVLRATAAGLYEER